ncbi:MAG TPA: CAP domain-containing protein, partial [Vicinamibacteria bacterium]
GWRLCGLLAIEALLACACRPGGSTTGSGRPSPSAGPLPDRVVEDLVAAHNGVRDAVEAPPADSPHWEPLPPVRWSSEVAASAQAWADHLRDRNGCALVHDDRSPYGENLAAGRGLSPAGAVRRWASEKDLYTFGPVRSLVAGHYTQIVWRDSVEIGCGMAGCADGTRVVCCRYSPPGNVIGRPPY